MRASKLTRTASVAAVAIAVGTAGLAISATANAATPAKDAKTTLSIKLSKTNVITGTLAEGKVDLAKETVYLETVAGKKTTVVAHAVTSKAGAVHFTVKPMTTTTYELVFKGAKGLDAAHSAHVTCKAMMM
jgi:hypothetical protein